MIYAMTYEIEGICGGSVNTSQMEIINFAKSMAETALDQLDDAISLGEWFDLSGNETEPMKSLLSGDIDEIQDMIGQISDRLKAKKMGFIDLWEYQDIFQLIEYHDVTSWCSKSLKDHIATARKANCGLVQEFANEWSNC